MTTGEPNNLRIIEQVYAAFGRGDVPAVLAMLTDDVEWEHARPAEIPWGGCRRGREEVIQFFVALGGMVEVEQFEPQEFIAEGDTVMVLGHERMRVKATGRAYDVAWAQAFTLRDGQIARFREYTDTAAIVEALR